MPNDRKDNELMTRIVMCLVAMVMLTTLAFCAPQPAHAGDFLYSCKGSTTDCRVVLNATLNNEHLQAKANGVNYYWCNGWNTTASCVTTGVTKVLDGEFTIQQLMQFDFSIKTDKDAGWVCYPKY